MEAQNKKPENPQAFPMDYDSQGYRMESGMTLRDYFANTAIIDKTINFGMIKKIMGSDYPLDEIESMKFSFDLEAKLKYMKADAMLKQREL